MKSLGGLVLGAVLVVLPACGGNQGLQSKLIDASVQKPSNIAVYFTVEAADGEPVPGLEADSYRVYEDDRLVSVHESKQTILSRDPSTNLESGSLTYEFEAKGFGPNRDPTKAPRFDVRRPNPVAHNTRPNR